MIEPSKVEGPELGLLHRIGFADEPRIRSLLERVRERAVTLESGLDRQLEREKAWLESIDANSLTLRVQNFDLDRRESVALTFPFEGEVYLMNTALLEVNPTTGRIRIAGPKTLYRVERRERERRRPSEATEIPSRARLRWHQVEIADARVVDYSDDGVALMLHGRNRPRFSEAVQIRFLDGSGADIERFGVVTRKGQEREDGWEEIGLSITAAPPGPLVGVERRNTLLKRTHTATLRDRWHVLSGVARIAIRRELGRLGIERSNTISPNVIRFPNARGEHIVAICDAWRPGPGTPVVVIPPAWAKTKETLLPLASTIVATFRRAGLPISVLRLDGIRRRGESYNDPECRAPGRECHHMTFSQGVADIQAAFDFVEKSPEFRAQQIALVTFSGASIEARRALSMESNGRVVGWVSVVGAADLKSGLRTISGGLDYIGGCERGIGFGIQRVLGIETDADLVCRDALDNELAHLEDARRQMADIRIPITWIQGRYDAWIDPSRVREILSCGDSSHRRLIEVPTGHQLRTSRDALETFQLVASEIGRFLTGKTLEPALPNLPSLESRRLAERDRLPPVTIDLRRFWKEYLLGRDGHLGMELLTATTPYRQLLATQVEALAIREGDRVVDLGSGTGTVPHFLRTEPGVESRIEIHQLDCVPDALKTARRRPIAGNIEPCVVLVTCDLSLDSGAGTRFVPMRDQSYDAAIASLLLNYVDEPKRLLAEVRRILRRGGRFVLSVLRRDTDISKIYRDAAGEIRSGKAFNHLRELAGGELEASIRSFLNEAARLLEMEEQGLFHFWESEELVSLLQGVGFDSIQVRLTFGDPPQAIVVSAVAG